MVTGTSLHSTKEALRLTRLYPDVLYSTAGWRFREIFPFFEKSFPFYRFPPPCHTPPRLIILNYISFWFEKRNAPSLFPLSLLSQHHLLFFILFLTLPNPIDFFLSSAKLETITLTISFLKWESSNIWRGKTATKTLHLIIGDKIGENIVSSLMSIRHCFSWFQPQKCKNAEMHTIFFPTWIQPK